MTADRSHFIRSVPASLLLLLLVFTGLSTAQAEDGPIEVGVSSTSFYPFNYQDKDGRIQGFNVDVVRALCRKMQRNCHFKAIPFRQLIPALETRDIQIAAGNFLKTPERAQRINFSDKYYRSTTSLVGHASRTHQDPQQILNDPGVRIAVTMQSTQWRYLNQHSQVQIVARDAISEALQSLKQNEADYLILPTLFALDFLEQPENLQLDFIGLPVEHPTLSGDVHLGISKHEPELQQDINQALEQLVSSGELRRLINQYFPFNVY